MEYYRAEGRTDPLPDDASEIPDSTDASTALDSARAVERVRRVLDAMPQRDSDILRALFIEEGDKEEVCRRFGVERDYLRVLVHRAKEKFKAFYLRRKSGRMTISETFGGDSSLPK